MLGSAVGLIFLATILNGMVIFNIEPLLQQLIVGIILIVSVFVDTKGSGKISDLEISKMIQKEVDLTPKGIIKRLDLKSPIYQATSSYGHFGRNEFAWEKLDLVDKFAKYNKVKGKK